MNRFLFFCLLIIVALGFFYFYSNFWLTANVETKQFVITKGEGANQISAHLREQGITRDMFVFRIYVWLKRVEGKMQVGKYEISPRTLLSNLVRDFIIPPAQREKNITIIEGWTVRDIGFYFENLELKQAPLETRSLTGQAEALWGLVGFQAVDYRKNKELPAPKDFSADYDFLSDKPKFLGLEGYLFPDTYRIREDANLEEMARKMLENFGKKLTGELRTEIKRQGKTIFDIVRMASLVEAEVRGKEDREMVADIFWRRLKIGMPLQADSAINYFTYKNDPQARFFDLEKDSPWNTYKYKGLPLGPIGNPGLESILAAIYPKANPHLYFLTTNDGRVIYSKTFDEHVRNKQKFLK